jgi:hypothetical protein
MNIYRQAMHRNHLVNHSQSNAQLQHFQRITAVQAVWHDRGIKEGQVLETGQPAQAGNTMTNC